MLALLALNANRQVSVDRLVDAVWDEDAPSTARGQIQICVSRLRRALKTAGLPDRITTRPPGYALRIEDGELDLQVFESLVTEGLAAAKHEDTKADAVRALEQALAIFAGEPLADIDCRLLRSVAMRLEERRLGATEEYIDLQLQLGRHHEVIDDLMSLVAEHPLRGRLRALQMTALHHAGRQADALATFQEARRELIDKIGVEPGAELRQLQMEILTSDTDGAPEDLPAAPDPVLVPRLLPPDIADFTNRTETVAEVRDLVRAAGSDDGSATPVIVAISGKGGVGKTRFALRTAHELAAQFPDGQLYAEVRDSDGRPVSPERVLGRFLRALGVPGSAIPDEIDECVALYRDRLAGRRVMVLLDDATDEAQILPLLPGSGRCLVMVTSRTRLGGLSGAHRIHLDVFQPGSAVALLERLLGHERVVAEPTYALELVNQCGGLPLALRVAAARLNARPHWPIGRLVERLRDEKHRLDGLAYAGSDIRSSINVSFEDLDDDGRLLLARLTLCETAEFPDWVAGPLLDWDVDTAADVLDSLVDAQLLDVVRTAGGTRYRLHELIRMFARERLATDPTAERLAALRRLIAGWLFLSDEAHRRAYGGNYTLIHGGSPRRELSAGLVDRILADPMQWLDDERTSLLTVIGQAADIGDHESCWDLALSMSTLFEARSYFRDWRDTVEVALPAVLRAGNRRGEAAMLYSDGTLQMNQHRLDSAGARLAAAHQIFADLGDPHGAALALRNLAWLDQAHGRMDAALDKYGEAITALESAGDRAGAAHVLYQMGYINLERGELDTAGRHCAVAREIARSIENQRLIAQLQTLQATVHLERDELEQADRSFSQALRMVRASRDRVGEAHVLYGTGLVRLRQGCFADARAVLNEATGLAEHGADQLLVGRVTLAIGAVHAGQEEADLAVSYTSRAIALFDQLDARHWRARALHQLNSIAAQPG
ncbi:SARP family transcriptional regulator [Actinoplanes sp. OR16]|nr:SARP family transcriptional regulator [Actinoplanes sp. OR16]